VKPIVICYHAVSRTWEHKLALHPDQLLRQVRALKRLRPVEVTFDDAYENIEAVLPRLTEIGVPVVVFVCTDFADRDGAPLMVGELANANQDDLEGLKTMNWDRLRDLAGRGIRIGSHTASHPHLVALEDDRLRAELVDSKQRLEDELGRPCPDLAYPYGEHDARVRAMAREAGYARGYAVGSAAGGDFGLPRLGLHRRDGIRRTLVKALTLRPRAHLNGRGL